VTSLETIAFAGLVFFGPVNRTPVATFAAADDTAFVMLYVAYFLDF